MERVSALAGTGVAASTGGWLVQSEQRVALLDIDVFQGLLSFDVPIGNLVILFGVCLSAYAAYISRQHAKERRRREGDPRWPAPIIRDPERKKKWFKRK